MVALPPADWGNKSKSGGPAVPARLLLENINSILVLVKIILRTTAIGREDKLLILICGHACSGIEGGRCLGRLLTGKGLPETWLIERTIHQSSKKQHDKMRNTTPAAATRRHWGTVHI